MSWLPRKPADDTQERPTAGSTAAADQAPRSADISWEFGADLYAHDLVREADQLRFAASPAAGGLATVFRGVKAGPRIAAAQMALDHSLEDWWRRGALPTLPVLRDGLLLLEAGQPVGDDGRALLLRAALHHRRGLVTALRHQTDAERTAILLAEAVTDPAAPLEWELIETLGREDERSDVWLPLLKAELKERSLAGAPLLPATAGEHDGVEKDDEELPPLPVHQRLWFWPAAAGSLLAVLLLLAFWQIQAAAGETITVPTGVYILADPAGVNREVSLPGFVIDRTEVTNSAYRACVAAGRCSPPAAAASATRPDYFTNPAFDDYPVLQVDQEAAADYCRWHNRRLPTADEWQVAASFAAASGRYYRYPWGDRYEPAFVERPDTGPVSAKSPASDSPLGVADLAGNAAEWTATAAPDGMVWVKGGSFAGPPADLESASAQALPPEIPSDQVGFRCGAYHGVDWLGPAD